MNWKEIKKNCPKGFELLLNKTIDVLDEKYHIIGDFLGRGVGEGTESLNERDLYDFFDEQGIRCFMLYNLLDGKFKPEIWMKKLKTESEGVHDWHMNRVGFINCEITRTEAESELFTKAFELLESKI